MSDAVKDCEMNRKNLITKNAETVSELKDLKSEISSCKREFLEHKKAFSEQNL